MSTTSNPARFTLFTIFCAEVTAASKGEAVAALQKFLDWQGCLTVELKQSGTNSIGYANVYLYPENFRSSQIDWSEPPCE